METNPVTCVHLYLTDILNIVQGIGFYLLNKTIPLADNLFVYSAKVFQRKFHSCYLNLLGWIMCCVQRLRK